MTTWGGLNPSFCVYELSKETLLPIHRKTYSFDIAESNLLEEPNWQITTDWTADFKM